jgi:hypothetical protein
MTDKKESNFMDFKFTGKDFIQLGVMLCGLASFYFTSISKLDTRITRLEVLEESLRRDISEVKSDVKEILREIRSK